MPGMYGRSGMYAGYALNPKIPGRKTKGRPGKADLLAHYLSECLI